MNARQQSPFARVEAFLQRIVEGLFSFIPSRLEPVELARKLERVTEDNVLQSIDRRLAPNVFDIYLSIKDHQRLSPGQNDIIKDLQEHLIEFCKRRHYVLRVRPVIRFHSDTSLKSGSVRIESELVNESPSGEGGTQIIPQKDLQELKKILGESGPLSGAPRSSSSPDLGTYPPQGGGSPNLGAYPSPEPPAPVIPQAWLTIRLPQAGQQVYRIEKPVVNIGRQLSNDIIVEDKRVSRYHAQVKYQSNGQFSIFDLGSTNGITINGTPNMRQHTLRNGDRFTIGNYDFYFERR